MTSYTLNDEKLSIYTRYLCTCSCYLIIFNTAFPGAAFVEAHSWKIFNFSSGSIVGKRLRENTGNVHALQLNHFKNAHKSVYFTLSKAFALTHPCMRIDVGSSKMFSLIQALHFCGPDLKWQCNTHVLFWYMHILNTQCIKVTTKTLIFVQKIWILQINTVLLKNFYFYYFLILKVSRKK